MKGSSGRRPLAAAVAALAISSCAYYGGVEERPDWQFTTHRHFGLSVEVRRSVLMADLDAARTAARDVERHPTPGEAPASLVPYLERTRRAAGRVAAAPNVPEAALAAAEMARSCGACHAAGGVGPRFVLGGPAEPPGDEGHPEKYRWALVRLWQGLVAPSDSAWARGVQAFGELPFAAATLVRLGAAPDEAPAVGARLRGLATQARTTRDPAERVEVVAGFLTTCGACHLSRRLD